MVLLNSYHSNDFGLYLAAFKVNYFNGILANLMFLTYNWLYVHMYYKASVMLPFLVRRAEFEDAGEDVSLLMRKEMRRVKSLNHIWVGLCFVFLATGFFVCFVLQTK